MTDDRWFDREKQVEKAHALVDLLTKANDAELPPMNWTLFDATGSVLHGEIEGPFDKNPHATFKAWVDFLGLKLSKPEIYAQLGETVHRASGTYRYRGRDVGVGIKMTIEAPF